MKILHLITDLSIGGAEMMLYKLLSRMDRSHFQNVVISMTDIGMVGIRTEALGIPVYSLGMYSRVPNPISFLRLLRLLHGYRPMILQSWLHHADLLGLLAGNIARVPAIVWNLRCSELIKDDHPKSLFWILRLLAKFSHVPKAVIVNSSAGRIAHERLGYKPVRWEVIPNGFDIDTYCPSSDVYLKFRQSLGLQEKTPLIGLVARFDPMKDHENFLKAASRLHNIRPDVHFVLVGREIDKKNASLVSLTSSLGLNRHVHLLGERCDIANIIEALDIAASSSYGESFPNAIGEAMSCGVPCVVTDVGDSARIVGDTGIVVPSKNPQALADGFLNLLAMNERERELLSKAARGRISAMFSIDSIARQYEKLYFEIANNSSKGKHVLQQ